MSEPSPLNTSVIHEFVAVLGQPYRNDGKDATWRVQARSELLGIHVLVNGGHGEPIVWVFDPNDAVNTVHSEMVRDVEHAARLAEMVRQRVERLEATGV